jgi:hypothetical protein
VSLCEVLRPLTAPAQATITGRRCLRRSRLHTREQALAEKLGVRPLQTYCHRDLGTLYATAGQREQTRAELSVAIELYRAMSMPFWLPQAETARVRVSGAAVAERA